MKISSDPQQHKNGRYYTNKIINFEAGREKLTGHWVLIPLHLEASVIGPDVSDPHNDLLLPIRLPLVRVGTRFLRARGRRWRQNWNGEAEEPPGGRTWADDGIEGRLWFGRSKQEWREAEHLGVDRHIFDQIRERTGFCLSSSTWKRFHLGGGKCSRAVRAFSCSKMGLRPKI